MARTVTAAWRWLTVILVLGGTLGAQGLVMAGSTEEAPAPEQSRTILAEEARATIAKAAREPTAAERRAFEYVKRHHSHAPAGTILVLSEEGEHWEESPGPAPEPDFDPELSALDPRWAKGRKVIIFVTAHAFEYVLMRSLGINIPPTGPDPLLGGVLDKVTLAVGESVGQWFYDRFPPSFDLPMGRPLSHSGPQATSSEGDSGWEASREEWRLEFGNEPREFACPREGICIAEAFDLEMGSSHKSTYDPKTGTTVNESWRFIEDPQVGGLVYEKETLTHGPKGVSYGKWRYVHDAERGAWVLREATTGQRSILESPQETGPTLGGPNTLDAETGNELTAEYESALSRSMLSGGSKPGEHEVVDAARGSRSEHALLRAERSMESEISPRVERSLLKEIFESEGLDGHDPDDYELAPWYEAQLSGNGMLGSYELPHHDAMAGVPSLHQQPDIGGEGWELTPDAEREQLEKILPSSKEPIDHEIVDMQGEGG